MQQDDCDIAFMASLQKMKEEMTVLRMKRMRQATNIDSFFPACVVHIYLYVLYKLVLFRMDHKEIIFIKGIGHVGAIKTN